MLSSKSDSIHPITRIYGMVSYILIVMIAAMTLTVFAERRQIQAPLLLAAVGIVASFIPWVPYVEVPAHVLLGVVLPPLLYSAALNFSFFSFKRRLASILDLGVVLVLVTAFASGIVIGWIIPEMSFALALLLGAVIAPPDAVSAVAIGSQLGLPNRVMTILKGESLINDAAALTLFSAAATAVTGGSHLINNVVLYFLYSASVGIIVGIALGFAVHYIRRSLGNPTMITAIALLLPFAAYALAEELHASGVMAVVFSGFVIGHKASDLNFAGRLQEREVWQVIDALLEAFVFAYIGLQFRHVIEDALHDGFTLTSFCIVSGALIVTVIVVRAIWVFLTAYMANLSYRSRHERRRREQHVMAMPEPLSWRENLVISWSGMRGVVTLAAAAGVPAATIAGNDIPGRGVVLPVAFAVAIGTLLLQGTTLPWLIRKLGVDNTDDKKHLQTQLVHAHTVANQAGLEELEKLVGEKRNRVDAKTAARILRLVQRRAAAKETDLPEGNTQHRRDRINDISEMIKSVLIAERTALIAERNSEKLDDEVMRKVLEDMDIEQSFVARRTERAATGL